jgi:hypothetical protein
MKPTIQWAEISLTLAFAFFAGGCSCLPAKMRPQPVGEQISGSTGPQDVTAFDYDDREWLQEPVGEQLTTITQPTGFSCSRDQQVAKISSRSAAMLQPGTGQCLVNGVQRPLLVPVVGEKVNTVRCLTELQPALEPVGERTLIRTYVKPWSPCQ